MLGDERMVVVAKQVEVGTDPQMMHVKSRLWSRVGDEM